jgi:hypothetical protein
MISQKALEEAFPGKGATLRALLTGQTKTRSFKSVTDWEAKCYNPPPRQARLEVAVNEVLEGYGTEAIFGASCTRPEAVYINLGDTYTTTLVYDYTRARWCLTSWGDWVERHERRGGVTR